MNKFIASTALIALLAIGAPSLAHAQASDGQSTQQLNDAEAVRISNPDPATSLPASEAHTVGRMHHHHHHHCGAKHHHCHHHHGHHHRHHGHHHHNHMMNSAQTPAAAPEAAPEQPAAQ